MTLYFISRPTLASIEKGTPGVAMGAYLQVLFVLGLATDLLKVATDDTLGRKLQDAKLLVKGRAPKNPVKARNNMTQKEIQVLNLIICLVFLTSTESVRFDSKKKKMDLS